MKRKIVVRIKVSRPPTEEQRTWLYGQIYKSIQRNDSVTQRKVAVKNNESIFVLKNKDRDALSTVK